jgi:hypothetical protein
LGTSAGAVAARAAAAAAEFSGALNATATSEATSSSAFERAEVAVILDEDSSSRRHGRCYCRQGRGASRGLCVSGVRNKPK